MHPSKEEIPDGFYFLKSSKGQTSLVKIYTPAFHPNYKGIGYGIWDGAGFMPLDSLSEDCDLKPVVIDSRSEMFNKIYEWLCKNGLDMRKKSPCEIMEEIEQILGYELIDEI